MKTFYSSTFIKKEELQEEGITYPIKLEYYKIINEDEIMKGEKARFGIKVVKTEYREKPKVEEKEITYLSNDEKRIEEIIYDFWKSTIFI